MKSKAVEVDMWDKKEKNKTLYYILGAVALIIIIVVLLIILSGSPKKAGKGAMQLELSDKSILSGESTKLSATVTNKGNELLKGKLVISADDSSSVQVTYPDENLLSFELYPGESVERIFEVVATTSAVRTDYELTGELMGGNESSSKASIILSVTRK